MVQRPADLAAFLLSRLVSSSPSSLCWSINERSRRNMRLVSDVTVGGKLAQADSNRWDGKDQSQLCSEETTSDDKTVLLAWSWHVSVLVHVRPDSEMWRHSCADSRELVRAQLSVARTSGKTQLTDLTFQRPPSEGVSDVENAKFCDCQCSQPVSQETVHQTGDPSSTTRKQPTERPPSSKDAASIATDTVQRDVHEC